MLDVPEGDKEGKKLVPTRLNYTLPGERPKGYWWAKQKSYGCVFVAELEDGREARCCVSLRSKRPMGRGERECVTNVTG